MEELRKSRCRDPSEAETVLGPFCNTGFHLARRVSSASARGRRAGFPGAMGAVMLSCSARLVGETGYLLCDGNERIWGS